MSITKVCVLVAGSWGTALAAVLADNGHRVALWTRSEEHAESMRLKRENTKYLPGAALSDRIEPTSSLEQALDAASAVVIAAPSAAMRKVAHAAASLIPRNAHIVHATKGFEQGSLKRMTEVIGEEISEASGRIAVLSGPSHAEEVIRRCPTTVVAACEHVPTAEAIQDLFMNSYFRVYTNPDVIGVEVSGALKNIIALGAGLSDGLGYGDNAKAALMTRGLAEIARLGAGMGANPLTFAGLAGVGDLVVTCTSTHSRNWRAGYKLGQGLSLEEVLAEMGMVVEGVKTTKAAHSLAAQYGVEMPITAELHHVLFEGKKPKEAVDDLMGRMRTHEIEEIARETRSKWLE